MQTTARNLLSFSAAITYTTLMQTLNIREEIYTVSRLNQEAKWLLEDTFASIWIEGEISNFIAHTSGHWYFSLKDASAQISCAMFKGSQRKLHFTPKNGDQVLLKARVSLYENRGQFQIIADDMEERGDGKLRRAFELLKKKLSAAGLFDETHKKPLPPFPNTIGIVTSPTGAAIRDVLHVLKRRYACTTIIIYPALVQGANAAPSIVNAIETANTRHECDVLIVARGGGSLEDLWPFNEESVANAIYNSHIPIITGIGHEIDFTIADFVADVRAPTPSAAAEMATPDCDELLQTLYHLQQRLQSQLTHALTTVKNQLDWMQKHLSLQHPKRKLQEQAQRIDYYERELQHLIKNALNVSTHQLANAAARLEMLSPLSTLKRGYAIVTNQQKRVITHTVMLKQNDEIQVQLSDGNIMCTVNTIFKP